MRSQVATNDTTDQAYQWPAGGLTQIPDWVYTSEAIYEREIERIFKGPIWNFVGFEAEIPNPGDFRRSFVGPVPVVVSRARASWRPGQIISPSMGFTASPHARTPTPGFRSGWCIVMDAACSSTAYARW